MATAQETYDKLIDLLSDADLTTEEDLAVAEAFYATVVAAIQDKTDQPVIRFTIHNVMVKIREYSESKATEKLLDDIVQRAINLKKAVESMATAEQPPAEETDNAQRPG